MTISALMSRFEFELFETTFADVEMKHDFFAAATGAESRGVRVRVTGSAA